jgi:hypothetical protein
VLLLLHVLLLLLLGPTHSLMLGEQRRGVRQKMGAPRPRGSATFSKTGLVEALTSGAGVNATAARWVHPIAWSCCLNSADPR